MLNYFQPLEGKQELQTFLIQWQNEKDPQNFINEIKMPTGSAKTEVAQCRWPLSFG